MRRWWLLCLCACQRATAPAHDARPVPVSAAPRADGAPDLVCPACSAPMQTGALDAPDIDEASGLVASAVHPGVYYVHNDSGDSPRFFAVDASGHELGRYQLAGAFALDWEDAAGGPCDGAGHCLYFGDIGDNLRVRPFYSVYRVAEPEAIEPGDHTVPSEALRFRYPDGSHDGETLLVHPKTGAVFVLTKVKTGASGLYRFPMPLVPGGTAVLEKVGEVAAPAGSPRFTGGAIHPQGTGVLLRTYTHLFYYPLADDVSAALAGAPCPLPVAAEKQGEAVAWTAAGDGYVTVSEGAGSPIHRVDCGAQTGRAPPR